MIGLRSSRHLHVGIYRRSLLPRQYIYRYTDFY